ncbi:hypothetical protein M406DRAFT_276707 [Cryphonectria parasitica EP155]|uniref:Polycomb protein VEFS-Box domain-containing protein n=1 Tax=Cryphonectria parasitica (strain ATCC 38755 / EP155) TaxID=660469 RepID=A0A9P5CQ76_CRYP1|nr:uncharacterized protein M406DRAFT_276707 [Cryphonectria parasitica EP155]KAF3765951.1 hypothetical protein M406DRAFT_276707 [Cryphonectria parasitica EP155]
MTKSYPRRQTLPFLHRNWISSVNFHDGHAKLTNGDDEHYLRPAKRRRFMESSPDSGIVPDIDGLVLHDGPVNVQPVMEINVLKISHKDSARAKPNGHVSSSTDKDMMTRARCKITITTPARTTGDAQVLYCDSQICSIRTSQNPAGITQMARVYLAHPFTVPEEKIYVERDEDTVFDLADRYGVKVELQSAGDQNWPPLDLLNSSLGDDLSVPRHWILEAEVSNFLDRGRRLGALRLRTGPTVCTNIDFLLDIDVRWTNALPDKHHLTNGQDRSYLAPVAGFHQSEEHMPLTNGHANGHFTNGFAHPMDDDLEEDAEGELTPSRSLRARGSKNYNLKDLSAKAQGRQPRKRSKYADKKDDSEHVLYRLPKEAVPVRELVVDGFSCCVCHAAHQSLAQLRAHLFSHAQYNFDVVISNPGKPGIQLDVSCVAENSGILLRPKVYQLGRPVKPFDLDKYVEGDDSWATSRLGPNNNESPVAVKRKTSQPRPVEKVLVPQTVQPLFDPLSKMKLVAGTEVRPTVADDSWLIQKHRDIVQDFCDVDAAEKEYIKEWDAFIQKKRIVSEAFIGRAVVEFVNEKVAWLLESSSRTREFGKHLTVLIARGLEEDSIKLVQARLQEARIQKSSAEKQPAPEPPKEEKPRKSKGCTVCGKPVRGPGMLICANEHCKEPFYHDDCIREVAQMAVEHPHWRCNNCMK